MRLAVILCAGAAFCSQAQAGESATPWWGFLVPNVPGTAIAPAEAANANAPAGSAVVAAPQGAAGDCPALALAPDAVRALVATEATRQKVDVKLAVAIARQESRFGLDLNSRAGAHGVMQLIPATAAHYRVHDLCDASENIRGGISYIKDLFALYRGNVLLVLAGYNAGEKRVKAAGGIPPLAETVRYVAAGVNDYYDLTKIVKDGAAPDQESPADTGVASTDAAGQRWIGGSVLYVTEEANK
jgi:soluble lytic murein transglycosylase-like protein